MRINLNNYNNFAHNKYVKDNNIFKPNDENRIKREPTKDQLDHIEKSMKEERAYFNSSMVPIDWDYVKETINLTKEEKKLRHEQDIAAIYKNYEDKQRALEEKYQKDLEAIRSSSKLEDGLLEEVHKLRADNIAQRISMGLKVSSDEIIFLKEVDPEKYKRAMARAKNLEK